MYVYSISEYGLCGWQFNYNDWKTDRVFRGKNICLDRILGVREGQEWYYCGFFPTSKKDKAILRLRLINQMRSWITGKGYRIADGIPVSSPRRDLSQMNPKFLTPRERFFNS